MASSRSSKSLPYKPCDGDLLLTHELQNAGRLHVILACIASAFSADSGGRVAGSLVSKSACMVSHLRFDVLDG